MTDDRKYPDHDDVLDARIRSLVATAVADAPPAPTIDETTIRARPTTGGGDRRWIAGGFAGLSVAAAIVALFFVSRPDEIADPVVPATQPTIASPTPTTVPEEQTATPASGAQVLYLSEAGIVGVDESGVERTISTEEMASAVLTDDGRILAQRATGTVPVFEPAILAVDQERGEIDIVETPAEFEGLTPFLHDSAVIDDEVVVLLTLRPESCPDAGRCVGRLVAWWPDTDEVRIVAQRNVFEGGWRLPTLADNGLVVGIELDSATHGFFAAAVPGIDGVEVPPAAELGLEAFYVDCETCPNAFTTDATGQVVGWLETDETSGDLTIVMVESGTDGRRATVGLTGFGDDGPPPAPRTQLLMPFAGFDAETGGLIGSFALSPDNGGPQQAWFGSLLDEGVLPFGSGGRVVFP